MPKYVYRFSEGDMGQKDLLGGKGANLAEMARIGLPVPPGLHDHDRGVPRLHARRRGAGGAAGRGDDGAARDRGHPRAAARRLPRPAARLGALRRQVLDARDDGDGPQRRPQRRVGQGARRSSPATSGSRGTPTGGSSRCSARPSSTSTATSSPTRSTRRSGRRRRARDVDLTADDLQELVTTFKEIVRDATGREFPQHPREQLEMAIAAVFGSWNTERARLYRRRERISNDLGTAVNVMTMVFGNLGETSGTGVAFTRDPSTGHSGIYGDYLVQRPGRGRRRRHPQHAAARRPRAARPDVLRRAAPGDAPPRDPLPRPVRHRVHHRARQAVDAADPGRQAHGGRRVPGRDPARRREPHHDGRGDLAHHRRPALAAALPAVRRRRRQGAAHDRAWPPRPAPPSARSCSTTRRPSSAPRPGAERHPRPAGDQPRRPAGHDRRRPACSRPAVARPRTPRSSRGGWARPPSSAPRSSTSTSTPRRSASPGACCTRATSSPSTGPPARSSSVDVRRRRLARHALRLRRAGRRRSPPARTTRCASSCTPSTGS